ncbi:MAG: MarC family protein [Candidatus Omnitrophica bacterium]|nr:MarC family protein [Candidatus Omnitrophota bacterium]
MFHDIFLAFVPLFFAVDPIGLLPIFASLTGDRTPQERKKIAVQSLVTALCLAVSFVFFGKWILSLLGITIGDFMIAGGVILFCLSMMDVLSFEKKNHSSVKDLGAVPIGTPLVVGPAVLTLCLMLISVHGITAVLIAVLLNLVIVGLVFLSCDRMMKILGESGSRVLSKVMALILASIGVMMVRKGILEIITTLANGN